MFCLYSAIAQIKKIALYIFYDMKTNVFKFIAVLDVISEKFLLQKDIQVKAACRSTTVFGELNKSPLATPMPITPNNKNKSKTRSPRTNTGKLTAVSPLKLVF